MVQAEVDVLLQEAAEADAQDDARYGMDRIGDAQPVERAFREGRLRKIREAAEAKQLAIEAREMVGARTGPKPQPSGAVQAPTAQRNFTDPESRIIPASGDTGSFVQAYHCHAVAERLHRFLSPPLQQQTMANTGQVPKTASQAAGHVRADNVHALTTWGLYAPDPTESAAARTDTPGGPEWPDPHGPLGR